MTRSTRLALLTAFALFSAMALPAACVRVAQGQIQLPPLSDDAAIDLRETSVLVNPPDSFRSLQPVTTQPPAKRLPPVVDSPPFRSLPAVVEPSFARPLPPVQQSMQSTRSAQPDDGSAAGFPALPPSPGENDLPQLPPLDQELWLHGGSYLYAPEGDHLNWPPDDGDAHYQVLRLPETWCAPQPVTFYDDFLGVGPIPYGPDKHWLGCGYSWDRRLVLYGGYEAFGIALEENGNRHDLIGQQLLIDLDFRLTGTERLHAQWRPLGEASTGGSFYQFSDPSGYIDNASGVPQRYWLEFEIASVFSGLIKNQFKARDYHVVVGKFPFVLHNRLLMNDEILGVVVSKNTIYVGNFSNVNAQAFLAIDDVDAFTDGSADLFGINVSADWRHIFFEATYAHLRHRRVAGRDSNYLALSATKLCGARTYAGRAMVKSGDGAGRGSGALFALETNKTRVFHHGHLGAEKGIYYVTAFHSTPGWNSISGGNFNRLRLAFTVDPVILLSAARNPGENTGLATGVQLFWHHEDSSLTPEFAVDSPQGSTVWGAGLRYQKKTGPRSFFEVQGVGNFSDDRQFRREGVSISQTILF